MNTYHLYLKTHEKTGLKYLGYTKRDPSKYKGSGYDWIKHIKKHGYHVKTIILKSGTRDEIIEAGRHYSEKWNIAESKEFANRIPETGGGIGTPTKNRGKNNPMYGSTRRDIVAINKSQKRRKDTNRQMKELWKDPEYKKTMKEKRKQKWKDPEYFTKMKNRPIITKPCVIEGMQYESINSAADALSLHQSTVSRRINSDHWPEYKASST